MRDIDHLNRPSPTAYAVVSLSLLAGFFGLLLAVAYPVPALSALGGAVSGLALRRLVASVRTHGCVRVPGTDISFCLASGPSQLS